MARDDEQQPSYRTPSDEALAMQDIAFELRIKRELYSLHASDAKGRKAIEEKIAKHYARHE